MRRNNRRHSLAAVPLWVACSFLLSACMQNYEEPARFTALETARIPAPAGARPGSCWAREVTPAVIESVAEREQIAPRSYSADGTTEFPAQYVTRYRSEIVEPRKAFEFETVCGGDLNPQFIASLQRALQARGYYLHAITGTLDTQTDAAIRAYQRDQENPAGLLSIQTARDFGLAPAMF